MVTQNQLPDPDVWLGQKKAQSLPDPETWLQQKQAPALPDPDAWMQSKTVPTPVAPAPAARAIPTLTIGGGPFVRQARRTPGTDVAVRQLEKIPSTPLVPLSKITEPYMAPEPENRPPTPVMSTGGFTARPIRRTAGPEAQQPAVLHGALKALEGMTTPQNIALMAALGPLTAADLEFLGFLNTTLLAGDAVRQGILGWQEAKKAEMAGDEAGAAAGKTQAVFDGLMAAGFLRHGTRSLRERGQTYSGMVDRLQAGIQSPHLDGPSLEGIRRFIDQPGALEPKDRADLLKMADMRAATLPGVRPVVANVPTARPQAEAPMPGTLAAGPFPGPQQSIRAQMNAPMQPALGNEPTGTATAPLAPIPQQPARAVTLPAKPGATLPGVNLPRATFDPNAPMLDVQRRTVFAIANDRGIPTSVVESVAGRRISQLTAGQARELMTKLKELTPAEISSLKPVATTSLMERAVQQPPATAAPTPLAPVETITVPSPRRASTFDPSKSLVNAIKSLGGIDPEKIRKAGLWTDWQERVPQGIRLAVQKNGATHGLDTLGGELGNLGYQNYDLPDSLIEALADPKKARAGLQDIAEARELEQAKAHIEELERRLGETEFRPEEFKMAGEEKPPIREPGEEGFARIFDFQKRKPGVKEDANELRIQLYETQDYADRWITRLKAKYGYPEDIWEHAMKADSDHFDYLDSAMENLKGRIAVAEGKTEPGEVVTGPWKGEEGFARYRDEKTKELFGEEPFALRGGTVAREEAPRVAPKPGELRPAPQQTNLLQGPLFERPEEARTIPEPQPTEAGPFTSQDVERFNRLSHFPKDLAKENASFNAESAQWRQEAIDRLKRYGVNEIPEDVENALSRLRAARLNMAKEFTRAREVAPPWTVTGRSNYRGNPERAHAIEGKAVNEYEAAKEYLDRALSRHSPNAPISADKENAPDLLQAKIDKAEKHQEAMRLANAIVRKKGLTDEQKIEQIANLLDISKETAAKVLQPDYAGRVGFADYQLQNNLANIKRMKARVSGIEQTRATPGGELEFEGGHIVDNAEANRIQLFFDAKPDSTTIIKLKSRGFKWSPSQGAWQRQRTENARYAVVQVLGDKFPQGERGRFLGTQARGPAEELPPTGPVEEKPARTQVSVEEEIKGLQGDIATGEMRLRSKVNAIGERLSRGELDATQRAVEFARARIEELGAEPAREPWEMTRDEFMRQDAEKREAMGSKPEPLIADAKHETAVRSALEAGESVPPDVLRDYPELAKPRPVSEAAGQFAQTEVDRRAETAATFVDRVINGKGSWSDKRKQLGLENYGRYDIQRFPDVPISKYERQSLLDRMMAETKEVTGLTPTGEQAKSAPVKPTIRTLFGDDAGFFKFRDRPGIDDDPQMKVIFDRLERAEKNARHLTLDALPRPGEEDVPGSHMHTVSWIRSADQALMRQPETAPVAREIKYAARDKKRAMQHYDDVANAIIKGNGIKKNSQEDRMVKDLLDESYTHLTPDKLLRSTIYSGNKLAAIKAAERLRNEVFEPIINKIRGDAELIEIIGKRGYIHGYFPHWEADMRAKFGQGAPAMMRNLLPQRFMSAFLKEREAEDWTGDVSIFDVVPAYINSTMKTIHDIPAYNRALEHIKTLPDGSAKKFAQWYADNYIGQPKKEGLLHNFDAYQKFSRWLANRYYDNLIGLNYKTWLINLGQTMTNTFPELGARYTAKGIAALFTKEGREKFHDSGLLFDYPGIESGILKEGLKRRILHGGMAAGEYVNRGIAYLGGLEQAKDIHLVGRAAEMHAMDVVDKTQFAYGKESSIRYLENIPPDLRTFQTFPLKEAEFVGNLVSDAVHGGPRERAKLTRFLMVNAVLPAALYAAGVPVGRMFIEIFDLIPKPFRTFQLQVKLMAWLRAVGVGTKEAVTGEHVKGVPKVDPADIPMDILKGLWDAFGPAANIARQTAQQTGLIEQKKKAAM